jgi:hypothetical protein
VSDPFLKRAIERISRVNAGEKPVDVYDPQQPPNRLGRWGHWEREEHAQCWMQDDNETIADAHVALLSAEGSASAIDALAADIRKIDGNHDLGAGALAERLVELGWRKVG